jgi:hypothetical protein
MQHGSMNVNFRQCFQQWGGAGIAAPSYRGSTLNGTKVSKSYEQFKLVFF